MQQITLLLNGEAVDLGSVNIALKYTSKALGIDKLEASRSQSFAIPLTPRNQRILGFPHRPDTTAEPVRAAFNASLVYAGGQIAGTFKVTEVTVAEVTGAFVFGELSQLLLSEYKRPLGDLFTSTEHITLRNGAFYYENTRNLSVPCYDNGAGQVSTGFHWPSVKVDYLLTQCAAALGVNLDGSITGTTGSLRLLLPSLNADGGIIASGTLTATNSGTYDLSGVPGINQAFTLTAIISQLADGSSSHPLAVLRCVQPCRLTLQGVNTQGSTPTTLGGKARQWRHNWGWRLFRGIKWSRPNLGNDMMALSEAADLRYNYDFSVDCEVDDCVFFALFNYLGGDYAWNEAGITSPTTATVTVQGFGGKLELRQDSVGWLMGEYWLRSNMPKLSFAELLQTVCRRAGMVLVYDESTATFSGFNFDFDSAGGRVIDIDSRLKSQGTIRRRAFEYGTTHTVGLTYDGAADAGTRDENRRRVTYTTPNTAITAETSETLPVKAVLATVQQAIPVYYVASVECTELNQDLNIRQLKAGGDVPYLVDGYSYPPDGDSRRVDSVKVVKSTILQQICTLSTQVDVEVWCKMFEFAQIETTTRFTYRGGWYFCLSATWSNGVAKLTLQRYK